MSPVDPDGLTRAAAMIVSHRILIGICNDYDIFFGKLDVNWMKWILFILVLNYELCFTMNICSPFRFNLSIQLFKHGEPPGVHDDVSICFCKVCPEPGG